MNNLLKRARTVQDKSKDISALPTLSQSCKGELFVLYLSFLGWDLLSLLTLGILEIVYAAPYKAAAVAGFYDAIKGE